MLLPLLNCLCICQKINFHDLCGSTSTHLLSDINLLMIVFHYIYNIIEPVEWFSFLLCIFIWIIHIFFFFPLIIIPRNISLLLIILTKLNLCFMVIAIVLFVFHQLNILLLHLLFYVGFTLLFYHLFLSLYNSVSTSFFSNIST